MIETRTPKNLIDKLIPKSNDKNIYKVKRRYNSQLDPLRHEILILRFDLNRSLFVIKKWLSSKHNIDVTEQTIQNRILYWRNTSNGENHDHARQNKRQTI
ncbi:hypothetical protein MACH09_45170 [Vibrio sp. MACH09]|nr:hypothetical protein MACH09_45170 [Vibrio sp. MACH09]